MPQVSNSSKEGVFWFLVSDHSWCPLLRPEGKQTIMAVGTLLRAKPLFLQWPGSKAKAKAKTKGRSEDKIPSKPHLNDPLSPCRTPSWQPICYEASTLSSCWLPTEKASTLKILPAPNWFGLWGRRRRGRPRSLGFEKFAEKMSLLVSQNEVLVNITVL